MQIKPIITKITRDYTNNTINGFDTLNAAAKSFAENCDTLIDALYKKYPNAYNKTDAFCDLSVLDNTITLNIETPEGTLTVDAFSNVPPLGVQTHSVFNSTRNAIVLYYFEYLCNKFIGSTIEKYNSNLKDLYIDESVIDDIQKYFRNSYIANSIAPKVEQSNDTLVDSIKALQKHKNKTLKTLLKDELNYKIELVLNSDTNIPEKVMIKTMYLDEVIATDTKVIEYTS